LAEADIAENVIGAGGGAKPPCASLRNAIEIVGAYSRTTAIYPVVCPDQQVKRPNTPEYFGFRRKSI
jgi:hypothetical protein